MGVLTSVLSYLTDFHCAVSVGAQDDKVFVFGTFWLRLKSIKSNSKCIAIKFCTAFLFPPG